MAIDPAAPDPTTPDEARASELAALRRRIERLEAEPTIRTGAGAPTVAAGDLRAGTPYLDTTNNRLYIVSAGAWRYVALT